MTPSISNSAFRTLSDLPSPAIWVHNSSKADILRAGATPDQRSRPDERAVSRPP